MAKELVSLLDILNAISDDQSLILFSCNVDVSLKSDGNFITESIQDLFFS